jgi:type I restriction enzyme R subunit
MRDHVLLQAIARVNRPYEDDDGLVKPYGLVFDFVGIFEKLESALAFDSDFVTSVIQNIDVLKDRFATLMAQTAPQYLPLTEGRDDKAKERAVEHLNHPDARDTFFRFFRELETLYDIISPDVFLRTHLEDYQALAELFAIIHTAYSDRPYVDRELAAKTRLMLREHSATYSLDLPGAIHKLGPDELEALKQSDTSDTVKSRMRAQNPT